MDATRPTHIEEGFTFQEDHTLRADEHFRINELRLGIQPHACAVGKEQCVFCPAGNDKLVVGLDLLAVKAAKGRLRSGLI